jgi:hypothetical protein
MVRVELSDSELSQLRERKLYWWAVWCTPVCYVAWLSAAVCAAILTVRPGVFLAQFVLGAVAVAMAAAIAKGVAVQTLLSRWLDKYQNKPVGSDLRQVSRRQIHRASRRDALAVVAGLLGIVLNSW